MSKLSKTELQLLRLLENDTRMTVFNCDDHGVFATSKGGKSCPRCRQEKQPLDVTASINQSIPVYAVPVES